MPRFYHSRYLFEVARRTNRGEDLFDADDLDQARSIIGIFAEAQQRYSVEVYHLHFMSNHYHGLFRAPSPLQLARFFNFVHGETAKLVNRHRKAPGTVWSSKFRPLPVTCDARTLLGRMDYLTGQALRARLVEHPSHFRGVTALGWLISGVPLLGPRVEPPAGDSEVEPEQGECGDQVSGAERGPLARELAISKLPGFEDRSWPELHAMFAAMADAQAGMAHGKPPTGAEGAGPAADSGGEGLEPRGASAELCTAKEVLADAPASLQSAGPAESDRTAGTGDLPASSGPRIRGPVRPKGVEGSKRRGKLLILSCSEAAREAYLEELGEFLGNFGKAMATLRSRIAAESSGIRLRGTVVFPPFSLLPGCLAPR